MKKSIKRAGIITLAGLMAAAPVTVSGAQAKPELSPEEQLAADAMEATNDLIDEIDNIFGHNDEFKITPELADAWDKIDAAYDKINKLNEENSSLWVKLYGDVTERFDKDFDEKEYIKKSKVLTDDEKEVLINHIETEETVYSEINGYWAEAFGLEESDYASIDDPAWNRIRALTERSYAIRFAHPGLWDRIESAFFQVDRSEDFDYAAFIQSMETLSDEEKELALKDLNVRNILDTIVDDMRNSLEDEDTAE